MGDTDDNTETEQVAVPAKKKFLWEVGNITKANIKQLRLINIHTLPVRYSDKFYDELLDRYDNKYLKYAYAGGFTVGAICAREEKEEGPHKKLYLMTLNVFTAYRRYGIASGLLDYALKEAEKDPEIAEIYLHVQTTNEVAMKFYLKHGFDQSELIKDYYKKIEPTDCYLFRKIVKPSLYIPPKPTSENNNNGNNNGNSHGVIDEANFNA